MKNKLLIPLILTAVILLGCSFTVNVPTITTTNTQQFTINQTYPQGANEANVGIEMGGGRLNISAGASKLLEGTVVYNVDDWKPTLSVNGNNVIISQNHSNNMGIPSGNIKNDWTLQLGNYPISLDISAGAYDGTLDLSGLPITNLSISDGASNATVEFNQMNPVQMQKLTYKTGASQVKLLGLANANTPEIVFESGAGSYTLDFSGTFSKDLHTSISSGLSQVKIVVPESTHTIVNITGGLSNVDLNGTWTTNGTQYSTSGSGPTLTIDISMAVGNLVLDRQ